MLLTEMRAKFRDQTGNFADALLDSEIDAFMNRAFQYSIPELVDGQLTSGSWVFNTADGQQVYEWPTYVQSVRIGAQIQPVGIESTQDFSTESFRELEFWIEHDRTFSAKSTPYAMLHQNDKTTLYPIPDGAHTIYIPARIRPVTGSGLTQALASIQDPEGIDHATHANAVVKQAAYEFADDKGLVHVKARLVGTIDEPLSLTNSIATLNRRSLNVPVERRRRRTF